MGAKKKTRKGPQLAGRVRGEQAAWFKLCLKLPTSGMRTTLVCAGLEMLQASFEGLEDYELMQTLNWLANGRKCPPPVLRAPAAKKLIRAVAKAGETAQRGIRSKNQAASQ